MKYSERFALNHFLSMYPENLTFEEVLNKLEVEDDLVNRHPFFRRYAKPEVVCLIRQLAESIEGKFFPVFDLVSLIDKETVTEVLTQKLQRVPSNREVNMLCSYLDGCYSFQLPEFVHHAVSLLSLTKAKA